MKQLVDFDALFEQKLAEYLRLNRGKYSEKQWESAIPKLYQKFGDTVIARFHTSPKGYYADMTDEELVQTLERHFEEDVPVSDFLMRELESRRCSALLTPLLFSKEKKLALCVIAILGDEKEALDAYFRLLRDEDADPEIVDAVFEQLLKCPDGAKSRAIGLYRAGVRRELMLDLLSRVKERSEEVYKILISEFSESAEFLSRAAYLAQYGDPRALDALMKVISRDDINFLEYRELRYAVEALGGDYESDRDFTDDPYYRKIFEASEAEAAAGGAPSSESGEKR